MKRRVIHSNAGSTEQTAVSVKSSAHSATPGSFSRLIEPHAAMAEIGRRTGLGTP
jgi:hypothetical protein